MNAPGDLTVPAARSTHAVGRGGAFYPKRVAILGVGLLGGSIGLALKAVATSVKIIGYGHRHATLKQALEYGAIDEAATDPAEAVAGADLVILCTPVGVLANLMTQIAQTLSPGATVTDVGSTKQSVVKAGDTMLPAGSFVGSHPMAGSEKRGVEFARADLFQNALCILTPSPQTSPVAVERVEAFWKMLGMRLTRLSPQDHDRLVSDISHLPHAVAAAMVMMQEDAALALIGKGFLDATRIAGGDGNLWKDILQDNRDAVRASLKRLRVELSTLEKLLDPEHARALTDYLDQAAQKREALVQRKLRDDP